MASPKFIRLTSEVPTFGGPFRAGEVLEVHSVTVKRPGSPNVSMVGLQGYAWEWVSGPPKAEETEPLILPAAMESYTAVSADDI